MKPTSACLFAVAALALASCAPHPSTDASASATASPPMRVTQHRDSDDLLTAGLGLAGLRQMTPPAFSDPTAPTPAELRRRATWSNWRGIADLVPGGGFGEVYGSVEPVPGREYHALLTLPGAEQPHRVLVQVPDAFDMQARCVVVAPASGSRGVRGAIAVAGPWALPKGCAVAYTDKGAGNDYFDLDAGLGITADGTVGDAGQALAFAPDASDGKGVAVKHAHSRDNPEADWGRHVKQAAGFALRALEAAFPEQAPFTFDNTRIIAAGISNGGGAVLQAAALEGDWLDAAVAGAPNINVAGARPLYDYTTQAALLMPCALPALGLPAAPGVDAQCEALAAAGLVAGDSLSARQASALDTLRKDGWTDAALRAGSISVAFDVWRAVAVTYASAYGRFGPGEHPCGHWFSVQDEDGTPRPATAAERAAWPADGSGIPPSAGVEIIPASAHAGNRMTELQCLRALWEGQGEAADRVQAGVAEVTSDVPRSGLPVLVVHGLDDGLIPTAFSSAPYVAAAQAAGREVSYWQVRNAQHFDAFLGLPVYAAQYVPLLPYVYEGLDRVWAVLEDEAAMPADATIEAQPRAGEPLQKADLAMPD